MLILVAILLVVMFFMSSRTRKQQREAAEFRNNLTVGTKVMTASGMIGTVVDVDDSNDQVTIESFPGSPTTWLRAAVSKKIEEPVADDADLDDAADESDVTAKSETASTISPDANVPDDLSDLDTAKREYQEQQRRESDADGK
jgi:preprotein translocase subunit YajC